MVFGITHKCVPTVFRMEWPKEVRDQLQTEQNPGGKITNSDLEMAGLILLWLVIEHVVQDLRHKHILMLSDNSPSVSWMDRMASKRSRPAGKLLRVLAYRINVKEACLIPHYISLGYITGSQISRPAHLDISMRGIFVTTKNF